MNSRSRDYESRNMESSMVAEILPDCTANVLMQYDAKRDCVTNKSKSKSLYQTLQLFTGHTPAEISKDLSEKELILKYLVKQQIKDVDSVGKLMAEYYTNKDAVMKYVRTNKTFITPEVRDEAGKEASGPLPARPQKKEDD